MTRCSNTVESLTSCKQWCKRQAKENTNITTSKKFSISNVSSFRGFDVIDGEIYLSDSDYAEFLDKVYEEVTICDYEYSAGDVLKEVDPTAFRCGKNDYKNDMQAELEQQLENEDESDIEFIEEFEEDEDSGV